MKDDRVYLGHILRCIARIEGYTVEGRDRFFASPLVQDGVIRNLQTLAESSRRLSEGVKVLHPGVDWKGLAGFRNVLVHDYLGVDLEWDPKKAAANLTKHKVSFDEATSVFTDPFALTFDDPDHSLIHARPATKTEAHAYQESRWADNQSWKT